MNPLCQLLSVLGGACGVVSIVDVETGAQCDAPETLDDIVLQEATAGTQNLVVYLPPNSTVVLDDVLHVPRAFSPPHEPFSVTLMVSDGDCSTTQHPDPADNPVQIIHPIAVDQVANVEGILILTEGIELTGEILSTGSFGKQ